jgi:hypothetical protein
LECRDGRDDWMANRQTPRCEQLPMGEADVRTRRTVVVGRRGMPVELLA